MTGPAGLGVELAEDAARRALASWDDNSSNALYLTRGCALAETTRQLLRQLDAERKARTS